MRISRILLMIVLIPQLIAACSSKKSVEVPAWQPNPFLSTTVAAQPEVETSVRLEDGAQVIIPVNALSGEAQVTLERNPQKPTALPALPEGVTQLSDFYSVNIEGAELQTAVELILPFGMASIPDNQPDGILVAMFPTESGWESVPVGTHGNYAILLIDRTGDPLIAWNFKDIHTPEEKQQYLEQLKAWAICSPTIALRLIPLTDEHGFTIIGRLQPAHFNYMGFIPRTLAAGVSVHLYVNKVKPYKLSDAIEVVTDADGNFKTTLRYSAGDLDLYQSYNWVYAGANCDPWPGEVSVLSQGWASINILPENAQSAPTEQPAPVAPTDNRVLVTIPDVVGLTKDEAIARLLNVGVMIALGDGISGYDVGVVFKQDPAAGSVVDPYQVVALIYITSEKSGSASSLQRFGYATYTCTS